MEITVNNVDTMVLYGSLFSLFWMGTCFMVVMSIDPHSQVKDDVESLLRLTPWVWKHLNTSFKVDSPVTVDVSLTSHYRLTGKHFFQRFYRMNRKHFMLHKQRDCASILKALPNAKGRDGVYTIYPDMKTKKLVYCDMTTDGGGWTVIHNRCDGSVDFYRSWQTYKDGFGKADGEYWLGNENIHLLTTKTKQELRVDLQKFSGEKAYAQYSVFAVGNEYQKYKLTVGGYSGTAGDNLSEHNGMKFSTKDQDNDNWVNRCAVVFQGGWWFNQCLGCNLNGRYYKSAVNTSKSMVWLAFGNHYVSLKKSRMMIRSKI